VRDLHQPRDPARHNGLLALLPAQDFSRLAPHLEWLPMRLGETVHEPGRELRYGYFPTTAIVSLVYILASGASAEQASIGNEGLVGMPLLLGGNTTVSTSVVQTAGHAYRVPGRVLKEMFVESPEFQRLLLRYTQVLVTQVAQTAVCNRGHSIEQQLCRWLLAMLDRGVTGELVVTQELVANALGVRREGVTEAAGRLQRAGIISYRRGHISVQDRARLETGSCECYGVVKDEVKRLLAGYRAR